MAFEEYSAEELEQVHHMAAMVEANVHNWMYVRYNAEHLPKEIIAQALGQMLDTFGDLPKTIQMMIEIEQITSGKTPL